jgi:hypothetical protein
VSFKAPAKAGSGDAFPSPTSLDALSIAALDGILLDFSGRICAFVQTIIKPSLFQMKTPAAGDADLRRNAHADGLPNRVTGQDYRKPTNFKHATAATCFLQRPKL